MDDAYLHENEVGILFGNDSSAKPVIEAARIMTRSTTRRCWGRD